jgi:hypothetical protein
LTCGGSAQVGEAELVRLLELAACVVAGGKEGQIGTDVTVLNGAGTPS